MNSEELAAQKFISKLTSLNNYVQIAVFFTIPADDKFCLHLNRK